MDVNNVKIQNCNFLLKTNLWLRTFAEVDYEVITN